MRRPVVFRWNIVVFMVTTSPDYCFVAAEGVAYLCGPNSYAGGSSSSQQGHSCQTGQRIEVWLK